MPGSDGFGERKGWDRASIAFRSRKPYYPDVSREDLILPRGTDRLRMLAICAVCAFAMAILYVGIPLLILGIFVPLGSWDAIVIGALIPVLTVIIFTLATHESRRLTELAREL